MRYTSAEIELFNLDPDREPETPHERLYRIPHHSSATHASYTWGGKIGKLVAQLFFVFYALSATGIMAIGLLGTPGLAVLIPSLVVGLISAINAKSETGPLKGFLQGFIASSFVAGAGISLFLAGTSILFTAGLLSFDVARAAFTSVALLVVPMILPVIGLAAATHVAIREEENITDTFWKKTMGLFYYAAITMGVEIGYGCGKLIKAACRGVTDFILGDTSLLESASPSTPSPPESPAFSSSSRVIMTTTGHLAATVNLTATIPDNPMLNSQRQTTALHRFYNLPTAAVTVPAPNIQTTFNPAARN